jgi:uncharacterized protein YcgL (UPF0745 family)
MMRRSSRNHDTYLIVRLKCDVARVTQQLARDRGRIAVLPGIEGRNIIVVSLNIIVVK